MTEQLYRDDAYARECKATVIEINDRAGILLDKTVFYALSGGQAGDKGMLLDAAGNHVPIALAVYDDNKNIVHVPANADGLPEVGTEVTARLDWDARYLHMRMHTCMHLLCSLVPFPVTGGSISGDAGRLDFDIPETVLDKEKLSVRLNALIEADHPVSENWISDEELEANPDLVRTMAVKPPMGTGKVRIVKIGEDGEIDLQPCGGTHVKSTGEIGPVVVKKIEKKGKQNRRVRVAFA
ncbi:MAG: alanyl-tRNA editing protein [Hyphomicrobiales bacterium]